jgi:hypothetical protein
MSCDFDGGIRGRGAVARTRRRHPEGCLRASGSGGGSRTPLSGTSWREPVPRSLDHHVFAPITSQRRRNYPPLQSNGDLSKRNSQVAASFFQPVVGPFRLHDLLTVAGPLSGNPEADGIDRPTGTCADAEHVGCTDPIRGEPPVTRPGQGSCAHGPTDRSPTGHTGHIGGSGPDRSPGRGGSAGG